MAKRSKKPKKSKKPITDSPAQKLAELRERRDFLMWQMDLAMEPRRILQFQFRCMIIGGVTMALPLFLRQFFPSRVRSPFANPPNMGAVWAPILAMAVLAISWHLVNRRIQPSGDKQSKFISSMKIGAFFMAVGTILMVVTGVSDLQREFTVPDRIAAMIESVHRGDQTSATVLYWLICALVGFSVATFLLWLYVRIVVEPSWIYRRSQQELSNDGMAQFNTTKNTSSGGNANQVTRSKYSLVAARSRTRLFAINIYLLIAASACLYFLYGRQRYMRDPVAVSFGWSAYLLNIVLVFEAFRALQVYLAELRSNRMTPERETDFARLGRWSIGNAAVAIVYNLLLAHGGLDFFTEILQKSVIPGWSKLQTWALSNLITVSTLNILCSLIAGWIGKSLSRSLRRRKRNAARAVREA